jgi:hypothetical protein
MEVTPSRRALKKRAEKRIVRFRCARAPMVVVTPMSASFSSARNRTS